MFTYTHKSALLQSLQKLCGIYWGPDLKKCEEILAEDYFLPFEVVGNLIGKDAQDTLKKLRSSIKNFSDAKSLFNHLEEGYVRLFINARGGIAAPLYQSCYSDIKKTGSKGSLMGESAVFMKQRFESKGLSIADDLNEPPDHLAIELEYLYFLLEKGWTDRDNKLVAEAAAFAGESMLPWIIQFRDQLKNETKCVFHAFSAEWLVIFLIFITGLVKGGSQAES
jgi:TorA maturation chaperone TorD